MSADDLGDGPLARDALRAQHDAGRRRAWTAPGALALEPALHAPGPRLDGGRFVSPLEAPDGCESVNTFPVLATDADDALLGAAIVLPDHPRLAPESRGDLFDGTEIEEALLLHVLAL